MNNDYDMKDMEQRVNLTSSKALRNKDASYKNIRSRYYNWRVNNYKRKISTMEEKIVDYNNLRKNEEGNKEYSGWVDYQAERFTNWRYQKKLKKLENKLKYIEYKSNNPTGAYKMFDKGLNKLKRLLAITEEQKEEINGNASIKNIEKSENKSETDVNNTAKSEIPTDFKVSDEVDMQNDKSEQEEKMKLSDDAINEEFDKAVELNNKDIVNNKIEQKENNADVPLLPDNNTKVKSDSVINEQPKENNSNIEKDTDKDKIISAEEVKKDLNSNNSSENYSTYTTSSSDIVVTPERIPYVGVNYEIKDEKKNRNDEIKQRLEDINTAMHGIEADRYFAKSDANYIDKQIEKIMNSTDLDYAQKKEKLQSIIKEQKEKEEQQQKAIEQKRIEKENLEKRNLEAMVTNIRNGISKQNELIDMLAEEDERVSSLEDEFNSSIGTR